MRGRSLLAGLVLALSLGDASMALDLDALWDYAQPQASEQRFRAALATARGDEALSLRTQIARTYSLRGRYADAHAELDAIAPALAAAGPEPRVRALLERGRTLRSAGDPRAARPLFEAASQQAQADGLAVLQADALHMLPLSAPDAAVELADHRRLLDTVQSSDDPGVRRWEATALNNLGASLNAAGREAEALPLLERALALREARGAGEATRVARWMVAHTLRRLGRADEALAMQLALERECDAAAAPDPYVYEELAALYAARGDTPRAQHYQARQRASTSP